MKKNLLYLLAVSFILGQMLCFQTAKSAPMAPDTIAKVNFSWDNTWDVQGWTSIYGSGGTNTTQTFPIDLGNNVSIDISGQALAMGTSGEPASSVVPDLASNTYNWMSNADETPVDLIIMGLDPQKKYDFNIYASRDDATASGERITTYTAVGTTISASLNAVGNTSQFAKLEDVAPATTGAIIIQLTKQEGNYGYINALIITEATDEEWYNLAVTTTGNGSVAISPESGPYEGGTDVTLTVTPDAGWEFSEWTGDATGTDASVTVTMDGNKTIEAVFTEAPATPAADTIVKVNFSWDNTWDVPGWVGVYGSGSLPVALDNGITIQASGQSMAMGTSGEPASSVVPDLVSNTYNWLSNTDETPLDLIIMGLDPEKEYDFAIFASRDDETASGDRTTTYTVVGSSPAITGSVNPVGNTDQFVMLEDVTPASTGAVIIQITKLEGNYGYINALIVTSPLPTSSGLTPESGITWHPVPAKDYLQVNNLPQKSLVSVYDITGRKVLERQNDFQNRMRVDISMLKSGLYIFKVSDERSVVKTFKVTKE